MPGPGDVPDDEAWAGYYRWNSDRPVRELLGRALAAYGAVDAGAGAIDLGCGSGQETRALLDAGFAVTAVDVTPTAIEIVSAYPEAGTTLTPVLSAMQDAALPGADLVYAGYALPFCPPQEFDRLWSSLRAALRPGGVLAVDLFGTRDDWAGERGMTFVDRDRVNALTAGLDVVSVDEVDADGRAYAGPKHWHRFEVVARQPVVA
jgi:trans-aconitate methyltransferase